MSARTKQKAPTTREEQINSNLNQMSDGLSRLKNLGITLQTELDSQNDLIDDVDAALDRNKRKTDRLNRDMNNLLKKKWKTRLRKNAEQKKNRWLSLHYSSTSD